MSKRGYRADPKLTGVGNVDRGDRRIEEAEAAIVQRIFRNFAEGLSPVAIAKQLNAEAVPGPEGRPWQDTTIRGHQRRGTGILRNELYIGRLVWNRMRYLKDPQTGKRVSRMNPREEWATEEVPALRIINQDLWQQVQERLTGIREKNGADNPDRPKFWERRRAQHLLTGKLFCASCGGQLSAVGRDYLACGGARRRGTRSNTASLRRSVTEQSVIAALRSNLMQPEDVREFVEAFTAEWNQLAAANNAERAHEQTRLTGIQRKIEKIVEAVMEGFKSEEMKQQLDVLSQQKAQLQTRLAAPAANVPSLHPNLAELYRSRVATLHEELTTSNGNNTAVLEALRDLIERVDFGPGQDGEPEIILTGALASMVRLGLDDSRRPGHESPDLFSSSVKVVAGARNHRELTLVAPC